MSEVTAINVLIEPDRRRRSCPRPQRAAAADDAGGLRTRRHARPSHHRAAALRAHPGARTGPGRRGRRRRRRGSRIARPPRHEDRPRRVGHARNRHREPDARARPSTARTAGQTDRRTRALRGDPGNGRGLRDGPRGAGVNATTIGYVARFVPDHCASNYEAHLSIGMARRRDLEAVEAEPFEPFDVRAEAVAAYQLGNNGTARRMLRTWPVQGIRRQRRRRSAPG